MAGVGLSTACLSCGTVCGRHGVLLNVYLGRKHAACPPATHSLAPAALSYRRSVSLASAPAPT